MAPKLPNLEPFIAAGINPKTGLPFRAPSPCEGNKQEIKKFLRVKDEQEAVNRFKWHNLPGNISGQELERMLYYRSQLVFFYMDSGVTRGFYVMPYALEGSLDFYGRYVSVHPVPMSAGTTAEAKSDPLSFYKLKVAYDVPDHEPTAEELTHTGVILRDYTNQLSQTILPRSTLNDPIIDAMSETVPYMQTALLAATGVKGMRVADADQQENVEIAVRSMKSAALSGKLLLPVIGTLEFQDLATGSPGQGQDFMLAYQSLDNLRLSGYGLDNGGVFEKKAHTLQSEEDVNAGPTNLVMEDAVSLRQRFCDIVNAYWGLKIWFEVNPGIDPLEAEMDPNEEPEDESEQPTEEEPTDD